MKIDPEAPTGFYEYEAAGLGWLVAPGGVPVAPVTQVSPGRIVVPEYDVAEPTADAAYEFGVRLAATHSVKAPWFGAPPQGWRGDGFVGHLRLPLAVADPGHNFGEYYARYRIEPFVQKAALDGVLTDDQVGDVVAFMDVVAQGSIFARPFTPQKIHGDLWSGNIVWSKHHGVVLVDPAAHGGIGESDLAMLQLFGSPFFDEILAGYDDAVGLEPEWEMRFLALQVHPLLVHALFFGDSYSEHVMSAVRRFV